MGVSHEQCGGVGHFVWKWEGWTRVVGLMENTGKLTQQTHALQTSYLLYTLYDLCEFHYQVEEGMGNSEFTRSKWTADGHACIFPLNQSISKEGTRELRTKGIKQRMGQIFQDGVWCQTERNRELHFLQFFSFFLFSFLSGRLVGVLWTYFVFFGIWRFDFWSVFLFALMMVFDFSSAFFPLHCAYCLSSLHYFGEFDFASLLCMFHASHGFYDMLTTFMTIYIRENRCLGHLETNECLTES